MPAAIAKSVGLGHLRDAEQVRSSQATDTPRRRRWSRPSPMRSRTARAKRRPDMLAPPTLADQPPRNSRQARDSSAAMAAIRYARGAMADDGQGQGGADGKAAGGRHGGLQGPRFRERRRSQFVAGMRAQGIVRHELIRHLARQARHRVRAVRKCRSIRAARRRNRRGARRAPAPARRLRCRPANARTRIRPPPWTWRRRPTPRCRSATAWRARRAQRRGPAAGWRVETIPSFAPSTEARSQLAVPNLWRS